MRIAANPLNLSFPWLTPLDLLSRDKFLSLSCSLTYNLDTAHKCRIASKWSTMNPFVRAWLVCVQSVPLFMPRAELISRRVDFLSSKFPAICSGLSVRSSRVSNSQSLRVLLCTGLPDVHYWHVTWPWGVKSSLSCLSNKQTNNVIHPVIILPFETCVYKQEKGRKQMVLALTCMYVHTWIWSKQVAGVIS